MSQMIESLRGDIKPLDLSSSSFLISWKGQRKRTRFVFKKSRKSRPHKAPLVLSISHVARKNQILAKIV